MANSPKETTETPPPTDDEVAVCLAIVASYSTFRISANISAISDTVLVTVPLGRALELAAAGLRETVGNKISSAVHKDAKTNKKKVAGDCTTAIEDGTYSFGGGGRSSDPVSKREHEIAVEAIKTSIRSPENTGLKKIGDYDVDALADRHAETHPGVREQAVKDVAASKALAGAVDLSSLAVPKGEGDSS